MKENFFNNDIIIHNQAVKSLAYSYDPENKIDISKCDIDFNLLRHKERIRDFKVQLVLELENFKIFVEGHYEFSDSINEENIDNFIQHAGLSTLIPFLRYSVYTITSTTNEKGFQLPEINIQTLIKNVKGEKT